MMSERKPYTTQLQAGQGLIDETKLLLSIYEPGMTVPDLKDEALNSGLFPMVSARRLRNIVVECFAPRYMKTNAAKHLKHLANALSSSSFNQYLLVHTADANAVLGDFIREVFWERYSGGRDSVSLDDAKDFVTHAVQEGRTNKPWSDSTIRRMATYLVGCCSDYGLLSDKRSASRQILPVRIQETTALYLAYKLHFDGLGDNAVIGHEDWRLFGLQPADVKDQFKRLARNGWLIFQSAGDVACTSWTIDTMEEVIDVIVKS